MESDYEVIIAGAGPGGSTCAAYLGRAGKKVLLLDRAKFPRDKTCGDALSGKSMKVIRELGLEEKIEKLPHSEIEGVAFSSPSGAMVAIPFAKNDPNRKGGTGYCMRRMHTDKMFFDEAKSTPYVTIKENCIVSGVIIENGKAVGVKVIDVDDGRKEKEFRAKVVVGADGVNSMVARSVLGEKAKLEPKHCCDALRAYYSGIEGLTPNIEIHFFSSVMPGYFWIFPLENGTANVGLGLISEDLQKRIKKEKKTLPLLLEQAIKNEPLIRDRFKNAKLISPATGWRLPFGSYRRKLAGEGWVLIGDAASLVDPFSGEGVGNATASARLAAKKIVEAIDGNDLSYKKLSEYEKNVWKEIGRELDTSYRMQIAGKWKWLLNRFVQKAATNKEFRELLAQSLANEEAKKNFANPLFYLKVLLT